MEQAALVAREVPITSTVLKTVMRESLSLDFGITIILILLDSAPLPLPRPGELFSDKPASSVLTRKPWMETD